MNCACGSPLHYNDPNIKTLVERIISEQGEYVEVSVEGRRYRVQRHYIALHGIKAFELEKLADLGIVERL